LNGLNFGDAYIALIPAGPIAGVIGGIAEGTGYENSLANSIQNIADDYSIHNQ